jgi:hypothetical protein
MVTSLWSSELSFAAVAGGWSLVVGVLGLDLGAQPPCLAGGAPHPPFGALGAAGSPGQRERAPGGALRLGLREPLAVPVGGELGELVHGGPSPVPAVAGLPSGSTVTGRCGRSPYVARTGEAQD